MTNHETEPVCKFEQGCHRVVPCDPGCGTPWLCAEEAGPEDVLVDAVALLREAATLYDAREQPKSAAQLRAMARSLDAGSLPAVSVPPPAPRADDRAAVRDRIAEALRFWVHPTDRREAADAVLAVLPEPADQGAALNRAADEVFALDYDAMVGEEGDENLGSMREAWDLGTIHAEKLLRRLADEAAVVPPPALTEEGRLRAQVEVLQQDAERDQGLAKVGARCMRDGHQGLIEQGRLVLEGWRFALSTALDLGTGAPWEAIHERVKELTAAVDTSEDRCAECGHFRGAHEEAEEPVSVGRCTVCADEDERHDFEELRRPAAVSGPVAGEQQNETPEATLAAALDGLHTLIATSSRDWGTYRVDAWLWAVLCGWDCEQAEHDETCTHGALEEMQQRHGWSDEAVAKARRYRAAVRALTAPAVVAQPGKEPAAGVRQGGAQP